MSERDRSEAIGAAVRAQAASVRAPERLHARVAERHARRRRRAIVASCAVAAGLAASLALAVVLVAGGPPSVQDVALAALRAPTQPAPAQDPRDATVIEARAGGIPFPSYAEPWGWRPVGARTDSVAGRRAVTVIYRKGDRGVHYTIVEGDPLPRPEGSSPVSAQGRRYAVVRTGDARAVAWTRDGHTCVLASDNTGVAGLLKIAGWR